MAEFVKSIGESDHAAADAYWVKSLSGLEKQSFPPYSGTPQADTTIDYDIRLDQGMPTQFTPSTIMRAAWALLLSSFSSSDDVVFGTIVTGRNAPVRYIENLVGPTLATVPIVVHLDYGATVGKLLRNIQDQGTEMIPFEQTGIQHIRRLSADTELACNFQSLLVVQPKQVELYDGDLFGTSSSEYAADAFNPYALMVQVSLDNPGLLVNASFDSSVISVPQMQRILRQFDKCVRMVCDLDTNLTIEGLISKSIDDSQIRSWNSPVHAPVNSLVHDLIFLQSAAQPQKQAIDSWE
jgi:non-ribosomal peptide synthetase component F